MERASPPAAEADESPHIPKEYVGHVRLSKLVTKTPLTRLKEGCLNGAPELRFFSSMEGLVSATSETGESAVLTHRHRR